MTTLQNKYDNLCKVLNEQTLEITALRNTLDGAVDAMAAMHRAIEPMEDEEGVPGRVPPAAMRAFVDALADIYRQRCLLRQTPLENYIGSLGLSDQP